MYKLVQRNVELKPDAPLPEIRDELPGAQLICLGCNVKQRDMPDKVFSTCSRCHAVKYCSRECQVADWNGKGKGPTKPRKHKDICKVLRESIEEFQDHPTAGAILRKEVFADWADQHASDGTFHLHEFLARMGLLGGQDVGYWAIPDVLTPYHTSGKDGNGFQNGQMLLDDAFPTVIEGWTKNLEEDEIIEVTEPPLSNLPPHGVKSWQQYLMFRQIPPSSVTPLVMTNVLSIYQMIFHELQLPALQKPMIVYLLAVESELNQIPLLQELVYLMPGSDLTLILLSPAVKSLYEDSPPKGKKCLLNNAENVLDVTDTRTNARLRVRLDQDHELFDEVPWQQEVDAVIGLNAGLASYPTWAPTIHKILRLGIPFSFSDQTRLIFHFVETSWLPNVISTSNKAFSHLEAIRMPELTTQLNPFNGIVGRDVAYMLAPNISNGYIMTGFPNL